MRTLSGIASGCAPEREPVIRFMKDDGSYARFVMTAAIERDETGKVIRAAGTLRELGDPELAELRAAQSHELLKFVTEHSRSAIAVHDKDLKYIYVSKHYLDIYKVAGHDIIGKHHYEVFPDLPQKWRDVHRRALEGEILSAEDDP